MKVREAIQWAVEKLRQCGLEEPKREAERILAHILSCDQAKLFAYPEMELTENQKKAFFQCVQRRAKREPLAYILGHQEFMSLTFFVNSHVLIPRPDTEVLVEAILAKVKPGYCLWDIGCGSGCIAISLAVHSSPSFILASDISSKALQVAKKNAAYHKVKIEFRQGNLWEAARKGEKFDVIVMNPPYVGKEEEEILSPEVKYEPKEALFPQGSWNWFYRELAQKSFEYLTPQGMLALELSGTRTLEEVIACFEGTPFCRFEVEEDLGGRERVLLAFLK